MGTDVVSALGRSLREAFFMFWETLWPLVFGFGLSGAVQASVVGPFLAVISFVCSVGNVPMAAALWHGGISFGGVISFIFADLITVPLLLIYRKYYGARLTLRLLGWFWAAMTATGLAVEALFTLAGATPRARPQHLAHTGVGWNSTTALNLVFLGVFAYLYSLHRHPARHRRGSRSRL